MPEIVAETRTVEPIIETNRIERRTAGLFINRNLDNTRQNYAKLKFNTKFILESNGIHLFNPDNKYRRDGSLPFFIRRFDSLFTVYQ